MQLTGFLFIFLPQSLSTCYKRFPRDLRQAGFLSSIRSQLTNVTFLKRLFWPPSLKLPLSTAPYVFFKALIICISKNLFIVLFPIERNFHEDRYPVHLVYHSTSRPRRICVYTYVYVCLCVYIYIYEIKWTVDDWGILTNTWYWEKAFYHLTSNTADTTERSSI